MAWNPSAAMRAVYRGLDPSKLCEHCHERQGTRNVCRWILTDIEWPLWCEVCVEAELAHIRHDYIDDPQGMMDATDEFLLGPVSVRDQDGKLLPTYGVRYPR